MTRDQAVQFVTKQGFGQDEVVSYCYQKDKIRVGLGTHGFTIRYTDTDPITVICYRDYSVVSPKSFEDFVLRKS